MSEATEYDQVVRKLVDLVGDHPQALCEVQATFREPSGSEVRVWVQSFDLDGLRIMVQEQNVVKVVNEAKEQDA